MADLISLRFGSCVRGGTDFHPNRPRLPRSQLVTRASAITFYSGNLSDQSKLMPIIRARSHCIARPVFLFASLVHVTPVIRPPTCFSTRDTKL